MNTTKILGEAVGIQSQGVVDRTETQTKVGLTSAIIIGQFKRGRVDRPMVIHNGNIRGQLGHEPNNPYYNAVQDCLDTGVPNVQVLRVGGVDNNTCDHAYVTFQVYVVDYVSVNGVNVYPDFSTNNGYMKFFQDLSDLGLSIFDSADSLGCYNLCRWQSISSQSLDVEIQLSQNSNDNFGFMLLDQQENGTFKTRDDFGLMEGYSNIKFSLSPNQSNIHFTPDRVRFIDDAFIVLKTNLNPDGGGDEATYKFWIDDEPIINPVTGDNTFTMISDDADSINNLFQALMLNGNGVFNRCDYQTPSDANNSWMYLYTDYLPAGTARKVKITQLGYQPVLWDRGIDIGGFYDFMNSARPDDPQVLVSTDNELTVEGYFYDPIDL